MNHPSPAAPPPRTSPRASPRATSLGRLLLDRGGDLLPLSDFTGMLLAGLFSRWISLPPPGAAEPPAAGLTAMIWIAAAIAPFILYDRQFAVRAATDQQAALAHDFARRLLAYLAVVGTIAWAGRWAELMPAHQLVAWWLLGLLGLAGCRVLLSQLLRRMASSGRWQDSVAVIGSGALAEHAVLHLNGHARLYGRFAEPATRATDSLDALIERAGRQPPDRILIALPASDEPALLRLLERLRPLGLPVDLGQQGFGPQVAMHRVGYVGDDLPVTLLADRPIRRWDTVLKSAKDLLLASALLLLLLPLLALIAVAIRLDSPGPVLFRQRRYGFKSREFEIYKFRTMYSPNGEPAGGLQQTRRDDPRITRVGYWLRKSSLDELPQIFNVIGGSMSLVGPRPHAVDMRTEQRLGHEITDFYPHRYRVKPGITGWSQVNGARGATDTAEQLRQRVRLDLHYVDNWSLRFDLKILSRTFREVLRGTNAY